MAPDQSKCPHCAEIIKREAIKCRFCNERVEPLPPDPTPPAFETTGAEAKAKADNKGCLIGCGTLVGLVLILLIIGAITDACQKIDWAAHPEHKAAYDKLKAEEEKQAQEKEAQEKAAESKKAEEEQQQQQTPVEADQGSSEPIILTPFGLTSEQFRKNFNKCASQFQTNLYLNRLKITRDSDGTNFTGKVNELIYVNGDTNKSNSVVGVMLLGGVDSTPVSAVNIILAIGQTIAGVDPKATKDERGQIIRDLGIFDENVDFSNLRGEASLHGIRYKIGKGEQTPFILTITHE